MRNLFILDQIDWLDIREEFDEYVSADAAMLFEHGALDPAADDLITVWCGA